MTFATYFVQRTGKNEPKLRENPHRKFSVTLQPITSDPKNHKHWRRCYGKPSAEAEHPVEVTRSLPVEGNGRPAERRKQLLRSGRAEPALTKTQDKSGGPRTSGEANQDQEVKH
jgi:hypothetical protein